MSSKKKGGFNLLDERLKRNISQTEIARDLSVAPSTVSRWENGEARMPMMAVKLLRVLWAQRMTKKSTANSAKPPLQQSSLDNSTDSQTEES